MKRRSVRRVKRTAVVAAVVTLLAACGGDSDAGEGPVAVASTGAEGQSIEPVSTAPEGSIGSAPATTDAQLVELGPSTPRAVPTAMTRDLRYHDTGEPFEDRAGVVDVIAPTEGDGPWPTVVVFHGDPFAVGKGWHRKDAQLIAEHGRVVFLPAWGHVNRSTLPDLGAHSLLEVFAEEAVCAVLFAKTHTEDYGGDPENITLYGVSAGGNALLVASFSDTDPIETCAVSGERVQPQALVPIEADWLVGGSLDAEIREQPELFYAWSPWRQLDGSQQTTIDVMVAERVIDYYRRSVGPDPATSWLSYRHSDIDLVADLDARGFLADGTIDPKDLGEYAVEILLEAGYDATLTVMPGATHDTWGEEGIAVVVDTVVKASGG